MLEVAEGIVAGSGRGEQADMFGAGVLIAPADDRVVVVFNKGVAPLNGVFCPVGPLLKHAGAGMANKDEIRNPMPCMRAAGKVVGKDSVVDAAVVPAEDECIDLLESFDGGNGGLGDSGDGVVVESDALPGAYKLKAVWQPVEGT